MKQRSGAWRYLWTAPDIRRKLLITLALMVLYRFVAQITIPGVDTNALDAIMGESDFLNMVNLISGGTLKQFSILGMGVYPYITAQIIIQLLTPIIPAWQKRMEDDPREGRKWQEKTTYYFSIIMGALTAFGQIQVVSTLLRADGTYMEIIPGFGFGPGADILGSATIIISMTAGTMFAIWLGELISEHGIRGQGLSLLIFAGIISQLPSTIITIWNAPNNPNLDYTFDASVRWVGLVTYLIIMLMTIFVIVFVQQGRRNVPVMYPGRRVGNRMSMPVKGTLPLQVNMAGMIPLIFASAILQFPAMVGNLLISSETPWVASMAAWLTTNITVQSSVYWIINFLFVVGFAFFYTDVIFTQQNYGENLKRSGAQIPGVSRGAPTQRYLSRVLRRITFPGALFLGVVAVLPYLATLIYPPLGQIGGSGGFLINSSGLLIVVGVVRDTFFNIEAELKVHGYDESLLVR